MLIAAIGLTHYLVLGALIFCIGLWVMATKRNAIGVLMGVELVLNGAAVNFVGFSSPFLRADSQLALGLDGHLITLFIIVLAAAEAAVALAIALCYYNTHATIDVDEGDELRG